MVTDLATSGGSPGHDITVTDESPGGLKTAELAIGGMHCASCASRVEGALSHEKGVVSAAVNLATTRAFVAYDTDTVGTDALLSAVEKAGYSASVLTGEESKVDTERSEHWATRAAISWALAVIAFSVAMFGPQAPWAGWTVLILAAAVELIGGWPFLKQAIRIARHGGTSMDTLIVVGTLAALAVSAVEAIALGGRHVHLGGGGAFAARLHGVMGPLIISILATGRAVEQQARQRAARAMHSLLGLRPPVARVVATPDDEDGNLVPPESIPVGALVRVRAGETIPLDGTVIAGHSDVDESMLTGEPFPVGRGPDQTVTGGTRNGSGALVVHVDAIASESVLARLQRLVDEAQREKAPLQRVADKVSSVFVPAVLIGSVITFLCWWLIAGDFGKAVLSAIALLLVACPCAMGLATPVAMMVGTGRASALGILVRGGDILEMLARADTVVFDKTGTLTESSARVTGVIPARGFTEENVLEVAASVEQETTHPIGIAIRAASPGSTIRAVDVTEIPGVGVSGTLDGGAVEVVALRGTETEPAMTSQIAGHQARGETIVVVTNNGRQIGAIALSTPLRPEAGAALAHLRTMHVRTAVLSGDGSPAVDAIARDLHIDDAQSGLSASDKVDAIRLLQRGGHTVVMVGDGINDAPALAAADVGCAIGSGTDAALANSGVALMGNDLEGVPAAVGLARSTLSIIRQNLGWAMGYNTAAIPLAAAGLLDPLIAAIAMGVSSLVVVLNSLRLRRFGSNGIDRVKAPLVMRGARGFAISVLIPVLLFASATVIGEAVSPARGQSLLPSLPSITTVNLSGGLSAEVYLDPNTPGVNAFHLIFEKGGNAAGAIQQLQVTASRNGAPSQTLRLATLSTGHYLSYAVLVAGRWNFNVFFRYGNTRASFSVTKTLSG
ncbi:MAG: cation-translocating P-type ATPase [Acidimicrobiales bacterium]